MTDATQALREAYLNQLSANLVDIGEPGFRELCDELGWNYDDIKKEKGVAEKAISWIANLESAKSIPALVKKGKKLFSNHCWGNPTQVERTVLGSYYIASSRKEKATVEELVIKNDHRFKRTHCPREAEYLIFDLDKPPENWIKYVGMQEHRSERKLSYGTTIFVQREQCQESCDIQLDGTNILRILRKLYDYNHKFNLAKTVDEMLDILATVDENRYADARARDQAEKSATAQAIASERLV